MSEPWTLEKEIDAYHNPTFPFRLKTIQQVTQGRSSELSYPEYRRLMLPQVDAALRLAESTWEFGMPLEESETAALLAQVPNLLTLCHLLAWVNCEPGDNEGDVYAKARELLETALLDETGDPGLTPWAS
jgi:hypothetical protein